MPMPNCRGIYRLPEAGESSNSTYDTVRRKLLSSREFLTAISKRRDGADGQRRLRMPDLCRANVSGEIDDGRSRRGNWPKLADISIRFLRNGTQRGATSSIRQGRAYLAHAATALLFPFKSGFELESENVGFQTTVLRRF
jgi:hypothetical protein